MEKCPYNSRQLLADLEKALEERKDDPNIEAKKMHDKIGHLTIEDFRPFTV